MADLAANPMPWVLFVLGITTFSVLLYAQGELKDELDVPEFREPEEGGFFGALEGLLAVVKAVFGVVGFVFEFLLFDLPSAIPTWLLVFVTVPVLVGLTWSVATLIRGN